MGVILLLFVVLIMIFNGLFLFVIYKDLLKIFCNVIVVFVILLVVVDFLIGCVIVVDVGIFYILEGFDI